MYFNPRAPCGARPRQLPATGQGSLFQSTRPVWGATASMPSLSSRAVFQSTRPVWGATHSPASDPGCARISIHAPRVGRDSSFRRCPCTAAAFQSTRPVWGATRADGWRRYVLQHFNPRAPCGARRRGRLAAHAGMANFNPRAPCGARLGPALSLSPSLLISIHAPRVGRDYRLNFRLNALQYFNPRAPCGARPLF